MIPLYTPSGCYLNVRIPLRVGHMTFKRERTRTVVPGPFLFPSRVFPYFAGTFIMWMSLTMPSEALMLEWAHLPVEGMR